MNVGLCRYVTYIMVKMPGLTQINNTGASREIQDLRFLSIPTFI
jgi:hypothetical protein